jgi:molecular chaperone DnaK
MSFVGIDLGTTYSAIATVDDRGRSYLIPNPEGEVLTPSAVLLTGQQAVVGQAALDMAQEVPHQVATLFKRRMGYKDFGRPVDGKTLRPETLSAILLKKLVKDAEKRLGSLEHAVITVPAYFDDTRRKATKDAGRIAGLNVLDIIDEPGAAALAYACEKGLAGIGSPDLPLTDKPQTILVYDLGGGTFDVTIVRLLPKRFQTLAIEGDVRLGGRDWDERIVEQVAAKFTKEHGSNPLEDAQSSAMLYASAERAKRTLSKLESTSVTVNHDGRKMIVPVTRAEFETWTQDLLMRTRLTTQQVIRQAGLDWSKIDRILIVGGSTHMPMTRNTLSQLAGKELDDSLPVSEVVARGAALHAAIMEAKLQQLMRSGRGSTVPALDGVLEIRVNAHSLGVQIRSTEGRMNNILIPKNTQLPALATRIYRTTKPGQGKVKVQVLQGESSQAEACIPIGECWIDDLAANLPANAPVEVTCKLGEDGILTVAARDMTNGKSAKSRIERQTGLSDEEIQHEQDFVAGLDLR